MKQRVVKYLTLSIMLTGLWSCGTVTEQQDSAPKVKPDVSKIPDAVPRDEPRSKYGNPASYEVFGRRYYTLASSENHPGTVQSFMADAPPVVSLTICMR